MYRSRLWKPEVDYVNRYPPYIFVDICLHIMILGENVFDIMT